MCGIAGWVDFGRDLMQCQGTVRAMAATMALRGPDAEGVWVDGHVAFGHRRLAVIDIVGGTQPMTVDHDGQTIAAITYAGEVYNYRELRGELSGLGHVFRTASDTEVVLHAYLEWGEAFVERLNGMFAFGLWDVLRQRLLLVRDRMGVKPLFYAPVDGGVVFGSEPKAIHAHPAVPAVVDLDGLRELLTFVKTPGVSNYRGVFEVLPGSLLVVDQAGIHSRRYWSLAAEEHTDDLPTTIRTVRELLDDIVTRQLISDVPLCTLLSGGLDSSLVTALAAEKLHGSGSGSGFGDHGAVRSFAVDFTGQAEHFEPDAIRDTLDTPFAHEVAKHTGTDHTDIVLDSAAMTDPIHLHAAVAAVDSPLGTSDMFTSLYLLFQAIRQHSTVALSGESADEVFGGYRWFHDQRAVQADTFPWIAFNRLAGTPSRGGTTAQSSASLLGLLHPELLAALDLRTYVADRYHQALAEVDHLPGENAGERRMREISYLNLTRFVQYLLDRKDRTSMANGLEVRVPFCDHRLVGYVYNTPWAMKSFDGREKSLLRAAVADLLPASVLERRKSPYPSTRDPQYARAVSSMASAVLGDPGSPVLPLLAPDAVERLTAPGREPGSAQVGPLSMVLGLDRWLGRFPVHLAI